MQGALRKIKQGGQVRREGVGELYKQYYAHFVNFYIKNRLTRDQAEEVAQDAFVNIIRASDTYQDKGRFEAWAWAIARNCLTDFFRKRLPEIAGDDDQLATIADEQPSLPEIYAQVSLDDCVQISYKDFGRDHPERAQVLGLVAFHEWSIEDAATLLGRTNGATREYLSQCRKFLKPYLERCHEWLD